MSELTEEERAALWQANWRARAAYQRYVWGLLQAPPEPRQAVMDAWQPVLAAQLEAQAGPTDPEVDL